jgi:dethiobiotin synthetase
VGKTVVSAALLCRYRGVMPLRYWKPIQTGVERDDDTADVRRLAACADGEMLDDGVRLTRPVSPHLAARLSDREIKLDALAAIIASQPVEDRWVVEGAGGVLVPVNASELIIDLIARLALATLVVARSGLGTINHTLLTLEALRARGIRIAGVVMVGVPQPENVDAIEGYGGVSVVGQMPMLGPLSPDLVARWADTAFDPDGHLLEFLR